ncbi:MAG: NAD(P)H-binding protein [Bacteroidia bacterium]|nr:NAD(P)H-binding protein [Bacteroidia bacterium]
MLRKALVIGATGLIGRSLVYELLKSNEYDKVVVMARKDLVIRHTKLEQYLIDFDSLEHYQDYMQVNDVFCCLGSTRAKTPDLNMYRKIDYEYPITIAKLALARGAEQFLLVSSMGADKRSRIFYNRVKGDVEDAITRLNYPILHIFRPALLLGNRLEKRPMEMISKFLFKVLNPFLIGPLSGFKAIQGETVAKVMVKIAIQHIMGTKIWLNQQIMDIGKK